MAGAGAPVRRDIIMREISSEKSSIGWTTAPAWKPPFKNFFYEDIPGSSGWHQVFGSVALFLFMVQAFTGILLAFNYAPTPGDAYNSVKYIVTEVTGGRLIHGLHHWGASMIIVVVVLHMTQVFLYGALQETPRSHLDGGRGSASDRAGLRFDRLPVALGQPRLLGNRGLDPNRQPGAARGAVSQAPAGHPDGSVGVVTFARFYALHVLILPQVIISLIVFHIYLVRKHGVAPAAG